MALGTKAWTKVHDAIDATADSAEIDCRGYNALAVYVEFSAAQNWTFSVLGGMVSGGRFAACYDNATAMAKQTNANISFIFSKIPDWVKLRATEDVTGATVTVWVAPCNV